MLYDLRSIHRSSYLLSHQQAQDHYGPRDPTGCNQPVLKAKHRSGVVLVVGTEIQFHAENLVGKATSSRGIEFLYWSQGHEPSKSRSLNQLLNHPSVVLRNKQVSL